MDKYRKMLLTTGADSVTMIDVQSVVTAPWTVYKCQFGCGRYGRSWCCPPNAPSYQQTREILSCYTQAILFRCHDMAVVTDMAVRVAREVFLDGYYKVLAFGSGPCRLCKECGKQSCNFPNKTVPAMEACGIDVFQTVRNNGYEITTLRTESEVQNHFGLILVE